MKILYLHNIHTLHHISCCTDWIMLLLSVAAKLSIRCVNNMPYLISVKRPHNTN